MGRQPDAAVMAALKPKSVTEDKLEALRVAVRRQRDLELQIEDKEAELKSLNKELFALQHTELPELFMEAGVDKVGLPPEGNLPAYDASLKPYYHANIAAGWAEDRRQKAFDWLENAGHGDLVKNKISVSLGLGDHEVAKEVKDALQGIGVAYGEDKNVPHTTLTAFVREQVEKGEHLPLDVLGATVGNVVRLKERKNV